MAGRCNFRLLVFFIFFFFFFYDDASPYFINKKKTTDPISDLFVAEIISSSELAAVALVGLPATNWSIGFYCFLIWADHEFDWAIKQYISPTICLLGFPTIDTVSFRRTLVYSV